MALPGHSPPPLPGAGSPTRMLTGHIETQLPPMYGHPTRSMLPPSPQNYRFPNPPPIPVPSPSLPALNDGRGVAPYKRPGSSMSISSMLGGEPERPAQELYSNHNSRGSSRQGSVSAPAPTFSAMSPPQQPSKPGLGEYFYKPRSQTPDKIGIPFGTAGLRQRSSSSGTPLSRQPPFADSHSRSASTVPIPQYFEQSPHFAFNGGSVVNDHEERARRTSLSGILQRPSSQPQISQQHDPFIQSAVFSVIPDRHVPPDPMPVDPFHRNGAGSTYDIKPPGSHNVVHPNGPQPSPTRNPSLPSSPETRRSSGSGIQGRTLASILNGPLTQPVEPVNFAAQRMIRQDSSQSQGDRTIFGDRNKARQYSPFAGSLAAHAQSTPGVPIDELGRKGSDELSQHRILLGLAAESKRGRYSPMPQAVQGAQAQTPVPDAGVKTEHGRVFSGLGGGIGTTPTPVGSQMRKDDNKTPLNEDNLMKVSRNTPGHNKRSRKMLEDDVVVDDETLAGNKAMSNRSSKKGKYQHLYKLDLEEMTSQGNQRRSTPLTSLGQTRNASVTSNSALGTTNDGYRQQYSRSSDATPILRPRKTIKVATIFNTASKAPRRHLGNFTYRPEIAPSDLRRPSPPKFDVSIKPNLLPSFTAGEHVNCTYTVHIPRTWLQDRERGLVCAEQYLWGSGIYTDDSDPIAAAIHAGFLKASLGATVDTALLSRVVNDQNPRIEWPSDIKVPEQPMDIQAGKDLNITLVVLPLLERYAGSARFGIRSRTWPEGLENTQHDGVSFGVLRAEFVEVGAEEMRMGRTGASRRERLRLDLEARQRGLQIQKERMARTKQKRLEQTKPKKASNSTRAGKFAPTSVPITFTNGPVPSLARQVISATA